MHWLICEEGHIQVDVFVNSDALPPCPECGSPTKITWMHGQAPASGLFRPTDLGNGMKVETKEEMDRVVARAQAMHPGSQIVLDQSSAAADRARIEERRHALYARQKKVGIDPALVAEHRASRDRAKASGEASASARGADPVAAGKKAAESVGTLAQAAGRKSV